MLVKGVLPALNWKPPSNQVWDESCHFSRRSPSRTLRLTRKVSKTLAVREGDHELEPFLQGCVFLTPQGSTPLAESHASLVEGTGGRDHYFTNPGESPCEWKRKEPVTYRESKLSTRF